MWVFLYRVTALECLVTDLYFGPQRRFFLDRVTDPYFVPQWSVFISRVGFLCIMRLV